MIAVALVTNYGYCIYDGSNIHCDCSDCLGLCKSCGHYYICGNVALVTFVIVVVFYGHRGPYNYCNICADYNVQNVLYESLYGIASYKCII